MAVFTNLVTSPEDFSQWTPIGTPVLTGNQPDPFGGTNAFLLEDNNVLAQSQIRLAVSFTGNGNKGFSLYVKQGPSPGPDGANMRIEDVTAGTNEGMTITWADGAPVLVGFAEALNVLPYPNGWWRILSQAENVVAANSHEFRIIAAPGGGANTGDVYVFGATTHDEPFCGTYPGDGGHGNYYRRKRTRRIYQVPQRGVPSRPRR